jgi:cytochrome c oxidase assembly factor CtaG
MTSLAALLVFLAATSRAHAHAGHVHWFDIGATWTFDPWVTIPVGIAGGLYLAGISRLWRRAGFGRGVRAWQASCFATGWLLLVFALVLPLHWLGERLFLAHMIEHEILVAGAAPLFVLGRPVTMLYALPIGMRRSLGTLAQLATVARWWSRLSTPPVATVVHGAAIWSWHVPAFYEAALLDPWIHWLQHLCFFGTGLLFWRALMQGRARGQADGVAVFYLFVTSLHTGFLGILISFARRPIYPAQTAGASEWGLTAMADQQLAGLFMWIPAGLVYTGAALVLAGLWIARSGSPRGKERADAVAAR